MGRGIHRPNFLIAGFLLICLLSGANSLYEDQVGKFDWNQKYFGHVKFILNDANQPKRVLVGTKGNVIGAINSNNGAILYRHVLESGGELKYFGNYEKKHVIAVSTVQDQIKIRKFESTTGVLADERAITGDISHAGIIDSSLYLIDAKTKLPEVGITTLELEEEEKEGKRSLIIKKVNLGLGEGSICEVASGFLVCVRKNVLSVVNVVDGSVSTKLLEDGFEANEVRTSGPGRIPCVILVGGGGSQAFHVLKNDKNGPELMPITGLPNSKYVTLSQGELEEEPVLFVADLKSANQIVLEVFNQNLKKLDGKTLTVRSEVPIASLESTKGFCINARCGLVGFTHDQLLFGTKIDTKGSSSSGQTANVEWNRHEALASVLAVEMVDFPSELGPSWNPYQSQQDVITAFISRIKYEVETIVLGESLYSSSMDRFGLRKLIVLVTSVGKVLGIDSSSGTILYSFLLPDFSLVGNTAFLYIQRPAKFAPLKPQATVIYGSAKEAAATTVLYAFNPVDGKPLDQPQTYPRILQNQILLHASEETKFLKPILLLDINHIVHTYPANIPPVSSSYFFLAQKSSPVLQGFGIRSIPGSTKLKGKLLWDLNLGPGEVIGVHGKLLGERVHSQGRVLPDRSVSYKYMNPNLVVVVTEEKEAGNINVFLVDAVSGSVIHSFWHKKCRGPVHVVHSEHWVVYSLYSEKSRRFEISSVELYEGQSQSNSTAFSSFAAPVIQPIVVKQAFVFPTGIHAMAHTRTEKGITNKDVLIAMPSGGLLELPRMILQPRLSQQHYVQQIQDEDGVILSMPYIPELPVPAEMIINYNQSLRRVEGIKTWPTRLESTCLVLAHGLDLFYTRVTPSKTFDVLKDDFDNWFIIVVLAGLVAAAYITKRLTAKKQLEQAWR